MTPLNIIRISKHCEMEWMFIGRSRARQEKPTQLSVADGAAAGGGKGIILKSQPNTPQNTLHHARQWNREFQSGMGRDFPVRDYLHIFNLGLMGSPEFWDGISD